MHAAAAASVLHAEGRSASLRHGVLAGGVLAALPAAVRGAHLHARLRGGMVQTQRS